MLAKPDLSYVSTNELTGGYLKPENVSNDAEIPTRFIIKSFDVKLEVKYKQRSKYEGKAIEDVPEQDTEWRRLFYLDLDGSEFLWQPNPTQLKELVEKLGDNVRNWLGCMVKMWQSKSGAKLTIAIKAVPNNQSATRKTDTVRIDQNSYEAYTVRGDVDIVLVINQVKSVTQFPVVWENNRIIKDMTTDLPRMKPETKSKYYDVLTAIYEHFNTPDDVDF